MRGFTRDVAGQKHYIDHEITSIQEFLSEKTRKQYRMNDMNVSQEHIFHTKMLLKEFQIDNYLFGRGENEFQANELEKIEQQLKKEMREIFYGINTLD